MKGGVIGFTVKAGRVHFEINVAAAEQEGLRISSKAFESGADCQEREGKGTVRFAAAYRDFTDPAQASVDHHVDGGRRAIPGVHVVPCL